MSGSYNVAWLCEALLVSRSGYYDWLRRRREPSRRERENRELTERIRRVFTANRCAYGSPRITRELAHYIHLNPVRAKAVPADDLARHRWSSLHHFPQRERPRCLVSETILAQSGQLPDTAAGWKRYHAYLAHLAEEDLKLREKRFGRLSRGWVVGSDEFRRELKKNLPSADAKGSRFELLGADREALAEARAQVWEEKLQQVARVLGVKLNKLPEQYSAREKVEVAAAMKQATSVSNGWLAQRLQMGQPASVSQFVRRFHLSGHADRSEFRRALDQVRNEKSR
ncbi:MAG: hypothetical protein HZA32_14590 [Opitutae bacterium]|nr:hypothetical protein [Opitutae bacterium]